MNRKTIKSGIAGSMLKMLIIFLINIYLFGQANAGDIQTKIVYLKGSSGLIVPNATLPLTDNYVNSSDTAVTHKLITPYNIKNIINLKLTDSLGIIPRDSISVKLNIRVFKTNFSGVVDSTDIALSIIYGAKILRYTEVANWVFINMPSVTVKILNIITNVTGYDVTKDLVLENEMQMQPQFIFSCTSDNVSVVNKDTSTVSSFGELNIYWPPVVNASQYDLEWTYIDSSALSKYSSSTKIFKHNASRVTVKGQSYRIPLLYDNTGVLFYRVRASEIKDNSYVINSNWTSVDISSIGGSGSFQFKGHERTLNWQSSTSFAEDGKRKTVVQYYDGSLRGRQTVTKDNTLNTTIVSETYYDYQGRPTVQVMPAPTLNTIIQYTKDFNVGLNVNSAGTYEYDKNNYDSLPVGAVFCGLSANQMGTSTGASWYYSSSNTEKGVGFNKYIPDAGGYAFTETEYTQDNTGRISRQSGVGPNHILGSGHETKYFYGSASQESLNALFGTDAGRAEHYFKNMVQDANGQYSVSYVDMHGRTVATALAGNHHAGFDTINSYKSQISTEKLIDSSSEIIKGLVIEKDNSILVSSGGTHEFKYDLNTDTLIKPDCSNANVPYSCLYDLTINIIGNCNNANLPGGKAYNYTISNYSVDSIGKVTPIPGGLHADIFLTLPEGNYDVSKQLSVSPYGLAYWRDSVFFKHNVCKSEKNFIDSISNFIQSHIDCTPPTCSICRAHLGNWNTYKTNYYINNGLDSTKVDSSAAWAAYQNAQSDCDALCNTSNDVKDIRQLMLADMSPPTGQYANTDSIDTYSIFNPYTVIHHTGLPDDTMRLYQNPSIHYTDIYGKPDLVFDDVTQKLVIPNNLDSAQFTAKFKASWADSLLKFHPEYCRLVLYQKHIKSLDWDRQFEQIDTYADAVSKNFFNPIAHTSEQDPLIAEDSTLYYPRLHDTLYSYHNVFSLWTFATAAIKLSRASDLTDTSYLHKLRILANPFDSLCAGDKDMAWRIFRAIYLQAKTDIYYSESPTAPACTATPSILLGLKHQLRFNNFANGTSSSQNTLPTTSTAAVDSGNAQLSRTLDNNCAAWEKTWKKQLSACPNYDTAIINRIVYLLYKVCRMGADDNHWYGSRDISYDSAGVCLDTSCTVLVNSFDGVLHYINDSLGLSHTDTGIILHCNADIITSPASYYKQIIYNNEDAWTKPPACECNSINTFYTKYLTAHSQGKDTSFSAYMKRTQNTIISEAELNTLRSMCNDTSTLGCKYLQTPITIPPAFQCNSGPVCVGCAKIEQLYNQFMLAYPSILPTFDENDSLGHFNPTQHQINSLFSNFMNNNLGYSLLTPDYLNFMSQCTVY